MPTRPLRPCVQQPCPALVVSGRCPEHQRQHEQQRRPEWVGRFYASTAWKKLRRLKRQLNPLCEACLDQQRVIPATEVDHRITLTQAPDRGLDLDNLRSLCVACHRAKTRGEGA